MKTLILQRVTNYSYKGEMAILGMLIRPYAGYSAICLTLELPWKNNTPYISCIPSGLYICEKITSPSKGETFEITGVIGRKHILFHKGNLNDDTMGCILLGESFNYLKDEQAITNSEHAFTEFMDLLKKEKEFRLDLRSVVVNPLHP